MLERFLEGLANDPLERLRWLVLSHFGAMPGSRADRRLRDADLLRCGAHMALDRLGAERNAGEGGQNPSFDPGRFARMKGAER